MSVIPSDGLKKSLAIINEVFSGIPGTPYWLSFGGLWAIVRNSGVIPDDDLDICVRYPADFEAIVRGFKSYGYQLKKAILNDVDTGQVLYCGFDRPDLLHICISFWIEKHGKLWWCHDENNDLLNPGEIGVPKSGYYFKGCPKEIIDQDLAFKKVEWPGLRGDNRVSVPIDAGELLDYCYPGWAYKWQRFDPSIGQTGESVSYYNGKAVSKNMVHLDSIADFDTPKYEVEFNKNRDIYLAARKKLQKSTFGR